MATILGQRFPIVTLKNKLTIVNYGSNHEYVFDTGEVLGKCSDEVCRATAMIPNHSARAQVIVTDIDNKLSIDIPQDSHDHWRGYVGQNHPAYADCKMWLDVFIDYKLSNTIIDDLNMIADMDIIDIILVPYLLMSELEPNSKDLKQYVLLKARTCKIKDRVDKVIHVDRFCGSDVTRYVDLAYERINVNGDEKVLV